MKKYLLVGLCLSLVSTLAFVMTRTPEKPEFPIVKTTVPGRVVVPRIPEAPPVIDHKDLPVSTDDHKIQVALLLDTSNSMDGLIEQAKSQLWKLVNEMASTRKGGKTPGVEIALYEYGNDNLSVNKGYVRKIAPMTTDLDYISEQLFSLRTQGGQEYCGWVIKDALSELEWTMQDGDFKLIVIAGNEPFDQGGVNFREFCQKAAQRDILINTIFCGGYEEGIQLKWKEGADLAGGTYANIDQNDRVVHVSTPYDDRVMELNERLNDTYIYYGVDGKSMAESQRRQDLNSLNFGAANARTRSFVKSKKVYKNADWDLLDAMAENLEVLNDTAALPEPMQSMDEDERQEFVEAKRSERDAIQEELQDLEEKVNTYIAEKSRESAEKQTLDQVMIESLMAQAKKKGFE